MKQSALGAALVLVAACVEPKGASGVCVQDWNPYFGVPGTMDKIKAWTVWDPDGAGPSPEVIALGGDFTLAGGDWCKWITAWDGDTFTDAAPDFPLVQVSSMTTWNGQLVAVGSNSASVYRFTGNAWQTMGSMPTSARALCVHQGELFVGGTFNGQMMDVAVWNGTSWQVLNGGTIHGSVDHLQSVGGVLYAHGSLWLDGTTEWDMAQWNGETWSAVAAGSSLVAVEQHRVAVFNGKLHLAGTFQPQSGSAKKGVAYWADGDWHMLGDALDDDVHDLRVWKNELIIAGKFTHASTGGELKHAARWDGAQWQQLGAGLGDSSHRYIIAEYQDQLFVLGKFSAAGSAGVLNIARWDGESWYRVGRGANNVVQSLFVSGATLYAGGDFGSIGEVDAVRVAVTSASGPLDWQPMGVGVANTNPGGTASVYAFASCGDQTAVGGRFTTAGGTPANNVALWSGSGWTSLGGGITSTGQPSVRALVDTEMGLVAGGLFTQAGDQQVTNIARWDGKSWSAMGEGLNGTVRALVVNARQLYAGGDFTHSGSNPMSHVARWDGQSWQPVGNGVATNVNAMVSYYEQVVVGCVSALPSGPRVLRWTGTTWSSVGSNPPYGTVHGLCVEEGLLVAVGNFTAVQGVPEADGIARYSGATWTAMSIGLDDNPALIQENPPPLGVAAATFGGRVFVGGSFWTAGDYISPFFAEWGTCHFAQEPQDLNCDGAVDGGDLGILLGEWGPCRGCSADFDGSGVVDGADLGALLGSWTN